MYFIFFNTNIVYVVLFSFDIFSICKNFILYYGNEIIIIIIIIIIIVIIININIIISE